MKVKKGKQIANVTITNGIVTAFDSDCNKLSLTRSQRLTLANYKSKTYIQDIYSEWQNNHVIHSDFHVIKDGRVVYTYTK